MDTTMKGKVCVVTGGTSGIGGAISRGLAAKGARVIMVARSAAKGRAAAEAVRRETGNDQVEFMEADLMSQKAVRALAARLMAELPRLDVLVNNVGGAFWERGETVDGVERTLALNLLTPFLLTEALVPLLKKSTPARVVNVATKPRPTDTVQLDDLQSNGKYNGFAAYGRAKTGLIMVTYELARQLEGTGITVNCFHPGVATETDFTKDMPKVMQLLGPVFATLFGMKVSLPQAADTGLFLASAPDVQQVSGKFFYKRKDERSLPQTYDATVARGLWDACHSLVARSAPAA